LGRLGITNQSGDEDLIDHLADLLLRADAGDLWRTTTARPTPAAGVLTLARLAPPLGQRVQAATVGATRSAFAEMVRAGLRAAEDGKKLPSTR
jgi:hypothetical protein